MNPPAVARPIQPLLVPDALAETKLSDIPLPAPTAEVWERNLQAQAVLQTKQSDLRRDIPDPACLTLVGPSQITLEALLVAGLWQPISAGFQAYNLKIFPQHMQRSLLYLPGPALATLLIGADLTPDEERLRSRLAQVTALFVPDLHRIQEAAPPGTLAHKLLLALLLARHQGGRPWYATWQGAQAGPVWSVLAGTSRVIEFHGVRDHLAGRRAGTW